MFKRSNSDTEKAKKSSFYEDTRRSIWKQDKAVSRHGISHRPATPGGSFLFRCQQNFRAFACDRTEVSRRCQNIAIRVSSARCYKGIFNL